LLIACVFEMSTASFESKRHQVWQKKKKQTKK